MANLADVKGTLVLDPTHSTISFVTRHAMVTKVRGSFEEFSGQGTVDGANPSSSQLEVTINPASVTTRNADRDAHLKSADFFDVENHPTWTFVSTGFAVEGETVEVTGDLTVKGTTISITIPLEYQGTAKDVFGNIRHGFEGSVQVLRSKLGLTWNAALETGGFMVSDKVTLEFDLSAIEQAG